MYFYHSVDQIPESGAFALLALTSDGRKRAKWVGARRTCGLRDRECSTATISTTVLLILGWKRGLRLEKGGFQLVFATSRSKVWFYRTWIGQRETRQLARVMDDVES